MQPDFLNRHDIYLNYFTIGNLIAGLFMVFSAAFLLTVKNKSRATWHMGMGYALMSPFILAYAVAQGWYHPLSAFHRWLTVGMVLPAVIEFTHWLMLYHLDTNRRLRLGIILPLWAISLATVAAWIYASLHAEVGFNFSGQHWDFNAQSMNKIVGFIIVIPVATMTLLSIWKSISLRGNRLWWVPLAITLSCFVASVIPMIINILSRDGRVEREVFVVTFTLTIVLGFLGVILIWINTTDERTTFMGKLVSTTLVTVLLLLQTVAYFTSRDQESQFDALKRETTERAINNPSVLPGVLYVIQKSPFGRGATYARSDYANLSPEAQRDHARGEDDLENTILLEEIKRMSPDGFRTSLKQQLEITPPHFSGYRKAIEERLERDTTEGAELKEAMLSAFAELSKTASIHAYRISTLPVGNLRHELAMYLKKEGGAFAPFGLAIQDVLDEDSRRNGVPLRDEVSRRLALFQPEMARTYRRSAADSEHYIAYKKYDALSKTVYEVGFSYRDYRLAMHQQARIHALLLGAALVVVVLLFPLFFRGSLIAPLNNLIGAVGRVNQGDLTANIPVQVEDEIGYLSASFNKMVGSIREARAELVKKNNELTRLDQVKDEFLANTSHELRTPLNGIIGIAESLMDGAAGDLGPSAQRNLNLIVSSGRRLASLVNDILDFSKLRNHEITLSLRALDLRQVTEVVLTVSRPLLAGKDLTLENRIPDDLPAIHADENRLQQILHNLVGNAIKFTSQGQVEVSAVAQGDFVEITVADTGIGIPEDKLDAIFQSFEQVDATTEREYGGTGLGLSISKQLVELHGGRLRVESEPGRGSRFIFALPKADGPMQERTEAAKITRVSHNVIEIGSKTPARERVQIVPGSTSSAQILVVDDEPVNRQVLQNLLSMRNFEVHEAPDGATALQMVQDSRPDLILLDVMMPRMNGYQVCRLLRESHGIGELPIIMLTAKNMVSDLVEGMSAGANDYIPKPFSRDELLARIRTQLELAHLNDSFSRFVPREFLRHLGKQSVTDVQLGDQVQREMTVLFSDIRSFTELSETMTPAENFDFLNAIFRRVGPLIRSHNGFIDKFIGDAIMALFPESPADALDTAIGMRSLLAAYNDRRRGQGFRAIETGTGIHTGTLMLGTIGEARRMDSTVISDAVNLTARLESLSKQYGASILISERVLIHLEDPSKYRYRFLDRVKVKGKKESVGVFEVFDGGAEDAIQRKMITRSDFERGLQLFHSEDFARSRVLFKEILSVDPTDTAARLYLQRAAHYMLHGPPPDWESGTSMEK